MEILGHFIIQFLAGVCGRHTVRVDPDVPILKRDHGISPGSLLFTIIADMLAMTAGYLHFYPIIIPGFMYQLFG